MMPPHLCTDKELLSLYDDVFRGHPATLELAKRMGLNGSLDARLEAQIEEAEQEADAAHDRAGAYADALERLLGVLNQDDEGGYFVCQEAEETVENARKQVA